MSSEQCKKLQNQGVEMMKTDYTNEEDLRKALKGAYATFIVTDYFDDSTYKKETEIGKKIIDIAKEMNVTHLLYSTLANVQKESKGKWDVPHFTQKAEVEQYARSKGFKYTTFPAPAFYFNNFGPPLNMARKDKEGIVRFSFPVKASIKITAFDPSDTGPAVVKAIENPQKYNGKVISYPATHATIQQYINTFKKVTGEKAKFNLISMEEFASMFPTGGEELAEMFGWFKTNSYYGSEIDLDLGRRISPNLLSWEQWLRKTGFTPSLL